jgi:hypothetical protein
MKRKKITDVSGWPSLGPYKIAPHEVQTPDWLNSDFCDGFLNDRKTIRNHVWSIGLVEQYLTFEWQGLTHAVPVGTVLISRAPDLYERENIKCLWLR